MFFGEGRIDAFREMICAETEEEREKALEKVLPYQQGDFEELYEALEGNPVTIRFLDPPLHEFVPTDEEDIKKLADAQGKTVEQIKAIIDSLHEFNPVSYTHLRTLRLPNWRLCLRARQETADWTEA